MYLLSPKRQKLILCCHAYLNGTGILTCFPFFKLNLRDKLGTTNPQLICIVEEPLPLR
jgi:hypothetical protein